MHRYRLCEGGRPWNKVHRRSRTQLRPLLVICLRKASAQRFLRLTLRCTFFLAVTLMQSQNSEFFSFTFFRDKKISLNKNIGTTFNSSSRFRSAKKPSREKTRIFLPTHRKKVNWSIFRLKAEIGVKKPPIPMESE